MICAGQRIFISIKKSRLCKIEHVARLDIKNAYRILVVEPLENTHLE
jgi:hypothetical protein